MEDLKQNSETLLDEAKKPFNRLMLVIAVVGIIIGIVGIVLFFIGTKERDISYEITEPTSLIFDSKNTTSNIKLLEKDSIPITENVYLLTGTLWNSGDLPINKEDIRKQLGFELKGANRILDFKLIKQKDETVANFKIEKGNTNTLNINWDYFDPKFGFTFQVIYTGNENPNFKIIGNILGISKFNKLKPETTISVFLNKFIYICFLIMSVLYIYFFYTISKPVRKRMLPQITFMSLGLIFVLLVIIWDIYFKNRNPL